MKNKYKESISKLHVSEGLERKILNMTVNKDKKKMRLPKLAYALSLLVMVGVFATGAVFAQEIKTFVGNVLSLDNGEKFQISSDIEVVEINDKAKKQDTALTVDEAEEMLGIDILTYNNPNTDIIYYRPSLNKNGTIGRVDLWYTDFINVGNTTSDNSKDFKYISQMISFATPNADDGYITAFSEGLDASGGKKIRNTYKIDNIDHEVVVYENDWSDTRINIAFVNKGIVYTFIGQNVTESEMIEVIKNLK